MITVGRNAIRSHCKSSLRGLSTTGKIVNPVSPSPPSEPLVSVLPLNFKGLPVQFEDVSRALYRISSGIRRSHCDLSRSMSEITGCSLYLKKDFQQFTGSFKERGARNALMLLSDENKKLGVVTASAGNHSQALAYHGSTLGIPVTCVMPTTAPMNKIDKCRKLGANVILKGEHIGESMAHAKSEFSKLKYINGFDDPEIIAGAGTQAIEILEQVPDVDVIVVPIGGGGLIAGVSLAVKAIRPHVLVIGVEPANVASYAAAVKAGKPVYEFKGPTLADGLAVPTVGPTSFEVARHFVDYTVTVDEREIAIAILRLIENTKLVVEGGGAIALAALLPNGPLYGKFNGKKVVTLLCGGNIDMTVLGRVIDRGLAADHRLMRFGCVVSDRPGGVATLTRHIADCGVSIKDIYHERAWLQSRIDQVIVRCVVETTGKQASDRLIETLSGLGYEMVLSSK